MTQAKLLITGVNGLIGGILKSALHDCSALYGLDRAEPFSERVIPVDIADYQQVVKVFQQFSPLAFVVHLAGDSHPAASWESVLNANIIGTRNVYEAAREFQVHKVIFASSNHVTGAYEGFDPNLHLHTQFEPEKLWPH